MKMRLIVFLFAVATLCSSRTFEARGEISFSAGIQINSRADFYDPLAASGAWVDVHSYGRCWHRCCAVRAPRCPRCLRRSWQATPPERTGKPFSPPR